MHSDRAKKLLIFLSAAAIVLFVLIVLYNSSIKKSTAINEYISDESAAYSSAENVESQTASGKRVYISGAVKNPDVYEIPEDYRVIDAVEKAAGGFTENADKESINLADFITDGQHIIIPEKQPEGSSDENSKININTADADELAKLSGIGEAKAENIVSYRKTNRFQKIDDIKNVNGIGDGIYEKIKDSITVG